MANGNESFIKHFSGSTWSFGKQTDLSIKVFEGHCLAKHFSMWLELYY